MNTKKLLFSALILLVSICANAQTMPVLRVSIDEGKEINDKYQKGRIHLTDSEGSVIELNAKFKTRGATAKEYSMKPSFNMKLRTDDFTAEQDSTLLGMRSASSWILDAMAIDRICMRNRVCFDLWNGFSKLPYDTKFNSRNGTTGKFLEVYINNTYYGIYCMTDRINRKLLNLKKVKEETNGSITPRGVIYKHGTNDIKDQNTPGLYHNNTVYVAEEKDAWELTEPEDNPSNQAWQPLIDVYKNQNDYDYIKSKFHLDNIAEYNILIMALSIEDNWGNKNNFFSARNIQKTDTDESRLIITPWDMDASLGGNYRGDYYGGNLNTRWSVTSVVNNAKLPFATCLKQEEYNKLLRNKWVAARDGALSVSSVSKYLHTYRDLFLNTGAWQRQWTHYQKEKYKPCIVENLTAEIEHIINWYANRHAEMDNYFDISTGITTISTETNPQHVYDLQGRKINTSTPQQGIYIKNGKKYIATK